MEYVQGHGKKSWSTRLLSWVSRACTPLTFLEQLFFPFRDEGTSVLGKWTKWTGSTPRQLSKGTQLFQSQWRAIKWTIYFHGMARVRNFAYIFGHHFRIKQDTCNCMQLSVRWSKICIVFLFERPVSTFRDSQEQTKAPFLLSCCSFEPLMCCLEN